MSARAAAVSAAIAGMLAVALGAFAAHALRGQLSAEQLITWHTAVDYQFWHALALFGVSVWMRASSSMGRQDSRALPVAAIAFTVGLVLFPGSLYALALGAPRGFGVITPFGGVAFIIGWSAMLAAAWRDR